MRNLLRQLRIACRALARQPGATLWIVATLALGIGAATAMFSYLAAWVWPQIDAPDPQRVVNVFVGSGDDRRGLPSLLDYQALEQDQMAVRDLISYSSFGCSASYRGKTTFAWGQSVSGGYFSFFAVHPSAGRLLTPQDDRPGAERVVVLSFPFWQRVFAGDPAAVGQPLLLNGHPYLIVGVGPQGFQGQGLAGGLYITHPYADEVTGLRRIADRDKGYLGTLGRLAPGVSVEAAQSALLAWGRGTDASAPLQAGPRKPLVLLSSHSEADGEDLFLEEAKILTIAASLFLLLACANVANLLLARATARRHDASLRAALGASRSEIALGVLLESLLLAGAGAGWGSASLCSSRAAWNGTPRPLRSEWGAGPKGARSSISTPA